MNRIRMNWQQACLSLGGFRLFRTPGHSNSWRVNPMLYWLGVYALVAIAVLLPVDTSYCMWS